MKGIFLLLGSNLGDRHAMLEKASTLIREQIGRILQMSSVYSTRAWGIEDQPDFLNQVLEIESNLAPEVILQKANVIEEQLGRVRRIKWHSRIIDIDILYYGNLIVKTGNLTIPHPENENRRFVLVPMAEIASDFIHPVLKVSQSELLERCPDQLEVKKISTKKGQSHQ